MIDDAEADGSTSSSTSPSSAAGRRAGAHTARAAARPSPPMTLACSTAPARSATATTGCSSRGQAISLVGTWMQQVAQGWLVLQLTHDPLWLGIVSVAQFGPVIIFGLFGGVIADQLCRSARPYRDPVRRDDPRVRLFGLTATGCPGLARPGPRVLLGISNAVDMPTRQSFAVEMVGREDVANAVGAELRALQRRRGSSARPSPAR